MSFGLIVVPIPPEQVELQRKIAALTAHWIPIAAVKEFQETAGETMKAHKHVWKKCTKSQGEKWCCTYRLSPIGVDHCGAKWYCSVPGCEEARCSKHAPKVKP